MTLHDFFSDASLPELLVFDKDGVLLDLHETWYPVMLNVADYLENYCDSRLKRDDFLSIIGIIYNANKELYETEENSLFASGTFNAMETAWRSLDEQLAQSFAKNTDLRKKIEQIMLTSQRGKTKPKGNIKASIAALFQRGHKLGVVTNDDAASTEINLQDLGIKEYFTKVVAADSGYGKKPEGGGLLACCDAARVSPQQAIMVGDTATDYEAAKAAGFRGFIAVSAQAPQKPSFIPHADAVVTSVDALVGYPDH